MMYLMNLVKKKVNDQPSLALLSTSALLIAQKIIGPTTEGSRAARIIR